MVPRSAKMFIVSRRMSLQRVKVTEFETTLVAMTSGVPLLAPLVKNSRRSSSRVTLYTTLLSVPDLSVQVKEI